MMTYFLPILIIFWGWGAFSYPFSAANFSVKKYEVGGQISVVVKRINPRRGGTVKIALFRAEDFPKIGRQFAGSEQPASHAELTFLLKNIGVGEYALAVFQDVNNDNRLSTNFLGLPTEPFGFSNDAPLRLGPPDFQKAKFVVREGVQTDLIVHLR